MKVCIIDPNLEKRWIPNYGVWLEEWEALDRDLQVRYQELRPARLTSYIGYRLPTPEEHG